GLLGGLLGLGARSSGSSRLGFFSLGFLLLDLGFLLVSLGFGLLGLGFSLDSRLGFGGRSGGLGSVGSESAGGEEGSDQCGQKFVHLIYLSKVFKSAPLLGRRA